MIVFWFLILLLGLSLLSGGEGAQGMGLWLIGISGLCMFISSKPKGGRQ